MRQCPVGRDDFKFSCLRYDCIIAAWSHSTGISNGLWLIVASFVGNIDDDAPPQIVPHKGICRINKRPTRRELNF
ncbi:hypothetical protein AB1N83_003788 [Pleurotus pulmonarius]